ncbi:hypothetical protein BJY01DRAFT_250547 [Aspergillus pseudoustus]|uniref:P-loop containing nucleoside triphosphate hydrolase protein n=1 Tax=Aspergillus pseudoustus TaxID=1810923 RepID=A0ABR4JJS1_9EURO
MSLIPDPILHWIYGVRTPTQQRTRPMQILAVGISRSGTESLREALHILGYEHTHHGFDTILPPYDLEHMYRLLKKKYNTPPTEPGTTPAPAKLTAVDFDTFLGASVGVCDLHAAEFAPELIAAYPEAKVILNTRTDLDAWHRSMQATMGYFDRNPVDWDWVQSWFSAELFWVRQAMCRTLMPTFFRGGFASNGKWVYEQHVAMIRGLGLPEERLLEWSVEDGWGPLCEFLGKEVPAGVEFPNGNPPKAWAERIARTTVQYHQRAVRNMVISAAVVVCVFGILVARFNHKPRIRRKMPPFTIRTTGQATISRPAERGILHISIHDRGPTASTVSSNVLDAANRVKSVLTPLSPRLASGETSPNAAITHWSMGSLSTESYVVWERRERGAPGATSACVYKARCEFEVKFRDFGALAKIAGEVAAMPLADIDGVSWALTDVSKRELARRARALAGKDALERAEDYAGTFGKKEVLVVQVDEEGGWASGGVAVHSTRREVAARRRRRRRESGSSEEGEEEGLSFTPEEVELRAEVTVKFVTE